MTDETYDLHAKIWAALDEAGAPAVWPGGGWMTVVERIKALARGEKTGVVVRAITQNDKYTSYFSGTGVWLDYYLRTDMAENDTSTCALAAEPSAPEREAFEKEASALITEEGLDGDMIHADRVRWMLVEFATLMTAKADNARSLSAPAGEGWKQTEAQFETLARTLVPFAYGAFEQHGTAGAPFEAGKPNANCYNATRALLAHLSTPPSPESNMQKVHNAPSAPVQGDMPAAGDRFRKKPVVITAKQWWKPGDHPAVVMKSDPNRYADEGVPWCPTLEGGHVVTPGDWIITGVHGEHYPCKPNIFAATYEPAIPTPPGEEAVSAGVRVKPLDLSTLLRDAFMKGRGLKDDDRITEEDQAAWMSYDPDFPAYHRIVAALYPTLVTEPAPEAKGKCCYGGTKPKSSCGSCAAWTPAPEAPVSEEAVARPMETAPKDHTWVRLLVDYSEVGDDWYPIEDSAEPSWTLGYCGDDHTGEDEGWIFVGWDWCHDCIVEARAGKPIGWLPFHVDPSSFKAAEAMREAAAQLVEKNCIVHGVEGPFLCARYDGDRSGLTYAAAIRALPTKGEQP